MRASCFAEFTAVVYSGEDLQVRHDADENSEKTKQESSEPKLDPSVDQFSA
jgi:hypothetical protein